MLGAFSITALCYACLSIFFSRIRHFLFLFLKKYADGFDIFAWRFYSD